MVGGGNFFRGNVAEAWGIERAEADNIGMLGTVMNGILLRGVLKHRGLEDVRLMTALPMQSMAEPFIRLKALSHLERDQMVLLACGIGQPYVTTDYPAVQRAIELRADAILLAKHGTDGIYDADPRKEPGAHRYDSLGYSDVLERDLRVMDQQAIVLARDYELPCTCSTSTSAVPSPRSARARTGAPTSPRRRRWSSRRPRRSAERLRALAPGAGVSLKLLPRERYKSGRRAHVDHADRDDAPLGREAMAAGRRPHQRQTCQDPQRGLLLLPAVHARRVWAAGTRGLPVAVRPPGRAATARRRRSPRRRAGTRPPASGCRAPASRRWPGSTRRRGRAGPRSATAPSSPVAQPPVRGPSSTASRRLVCATDSSTVATSSGRSVRRSTTSAVIPSADSTSAAASASGTPFPTETMVRSSPRGRRRACPAR